MGRILAGATQEQVISGLGSAEYFNMVTAGAADPDSQFVEALYSILLKRQSSSADVAYWVSQMATLGQSGVAAAFLASTEYRTDIVTADYLNLLHRTQPPSTGEVAFWVNSKMDLLSIAIAMEGTPEFFAYGG